VRQTQVMVTRAPAQRPAEFTCQRRRKGHKVQERPRRTFNRLRDPRLRQRSQRRTNRKQAEDRAAVDDPKVVSGGCVDNHPGGDSKHRVDRLEDLKTLYYTDT